MMNSPNLKRQIYHKGALNGNDINKLCQPSNIEEIVKIFVPVEMEISTASTSSSQESQEMRVFSDMDIQEKVETLLTLFSQIYELFSANHPLCKHEVELIAFRCYQFGSWFPTNFPEANLIRKFHVLTFHVPEKARLHWTVGMETEQGIESVHPFVNKWNRTFASITKPSDTRYEGSVAT